ncbi:MAG: tRNA (adenosine(37)-N6)-threonylcarbamoyltransferase complex dimerization subunit type 1 TsaB [Prevotella sp.]|nr:tRNA (adenosine(37)-N6)-threonylcarbamoyltransferase complex dimerization subunit type 1 TsaB [Prevotella sp.]
MSCILHIETSTNVCSVAVSEDSHVIFQQEDHTGPNHAERLGSMVDEAMSFTDNHAIPFDAVAVSCGPGSYTGLRIGVSMAKGICYGRNLKLIAVPTLELLCVPVLLREEVKVKSEQFPAGMSTTLPEDALLCPMLDARRMEVYAGIYDRALKPVRPVEADIVDSETYRQWLDERPVYFFGNGAAKCMEAINHPNAHLIEGVEPLAKWMQPLAERRLLNGETEDVAYFVPFYLKDYVAKVARGGLNSKIVNK